MVGCGLVVVRLLTPVVADFWIGSIWTVSRSQFLRFCRSGTSKICAAATPQLLRAEIHGPFVLFFSCEILRAAQMSKFNT